MKLKILSVAAGAAMLALQPATASAHTDVFVGLEFGLPLYAATYPVYRDYYGPTAVVYYRDYRGVRYHVHRGHRDRCYQRHDRGRHKGHRRH